MQQRRGTAAQWISTNNGDGPILAPGEIGFESDTNKFKIGDGINHWVDLTYFVDIESVLGGISGIDLPATLDTLNELAAALGDDPDFITTVATDLSNHESDTTNIHGIEDTSLLATIDYVDTAVNGVTTDITTMGGVGIDYNVTTDQFDIDDTVATKAFAASLLTGATKTNITITGDKDGLTITAENGVADSNTDNLTEGSTNKYFTDERAQDAVGNAAGTGISYNDSTGAISVDTNTIQARVADVSDTEIGYLNGVTSGIQTQLNDKAPLASPTFTGTVNADDLVISGDLTVNGTTTNINTTELLVEDINVILGDSASPSDATADGGGITLKGTSNKTITWVDSTDAWTSSEHVNIPTGKSYKVNNTEIKDVAETLTNKTLTSPKINEDVALTATATEINTLDGITASTAELNILDGVTASASEINTLDGVTASTAELNLLDGVTASTSEINTLTGITASTAELNILDGATLSTTELNYVDGVTSAIQTQLNDKAPLASPTFTGTVAGITKSMVGLENVDNTSDANKPVSTATQTALDAKLASSTAATTYAPIASPTFTGTVTTGDLIVNGDITVNSGEFLASATSITIEDNLVQLAHENAANTVDLGIVVGYNDGTAKHSGIVRDVSADKWKLFKGVTTEPSTTVDFTQGSLDDLELAGLTASSITVGDVSNTEFGYLNGVTSAIQTQIDDKAPLASPTFTGTVTLPTGTVTSGMILDGTIVDADINASAAIAQSKIDGLTTALSAKAPLADPTFTGTVSGVTKTHVGLGNVDNTSDANKPVSTATQTALDLKAPLASPTFTGTVTIPNGAALGTPTSATLTNATGLPVSTGISGLGTGVATFLATPSSANLASALTGETGTGSVVFSASPTFTGTVSAADLTLSGNLTVNGTTTTINSTTLSVDDKNLELGHVASPDNTTADGGGITLKGASDKTFNWVNATSAWTSSEHLNLASGKSYYANGTLLKDISETLTNKTINGSSNTITNVSLTSGVTGTLPVANGGTGITSLGTGIATFLGTPTSANLLAAVTDETGTGSLVFATSPTLTTPNIGVATGTSFNSITGLSSTTPNANSTAAVGTATTAARADHVHPTTGLGLTASGLNQFAATTSSQLAGVISDETGSGALVFGTSPSLSDPKIAVSRNAQTGTTYALVLADAGKLVTLANASAITLTVPTNASVAFPIGTQIMIAQMLAGRVTVSSSATLRTTPGAITRTQFSGATLTKIDTDEWLLVGDTASA